MKKKFNFDIKGFLNKKENMSIIALAVILCAGVTVSNVKSGQIPLHDGDVLVDSQNIAMETAEEETTAEGQVDLETLRANLDLERSQLIAGYDDTIKNSTNKDEQKNALEKKETLSQYMEQEVAIENIIATKGLPSSFVIITESTITVTVDEQELKQDLVTKIASIVMEETGRTADKIIIQSAY